jgi:hypothetical protein
MLRRRGRTECPIFAAVRCSLVIVIAPCSKEAVVERNPYLTEREQRELAEIERLLVAAERWSGGGGDHGGGATTVEREQQSARASNS